MPGFSTLQHALDRALDGTCWNSDDRSGLQAARDAVCVAAIDPDFVCECAALELQLIHDKKDGSALVPFVSLPSIKAGLAFGYWPPFGTTGPHEHTAWTITAVIRNALDVLVYDWAKSYDCGTLVESQVFHAAAVDVGYIAAPTIHDVRNNTAHWSLALHILSDHDGQRPTQYPKSVLGPSSKSSDDDPYRALNAARLRRAKVLQMAELVRGSVANPARVSAFFEGFMVGATSARIAKLIDLKQAPDTSLGRLRRVHSDLRLSVEKVGSQVRLWAYSGDRAYAQIDVTTDFADALSFVAEELEFEVDSVPGGLTAAERQMFARAIEDSCLFEAVR
jgi:hypothetical protein